jgi:hypothetical protein
MCLHVYLAHILVILASDVKIHLVAYLRPGVVQQECQKLSFPWYRYNLALHSPAPHYPTLHNPVLHNSACQQSGP